MRHRTPLPTHFNVTAALLNPLPRHEGRPHQLAADFFSCCLFGFRVEQAYIPELGLSNKGKESMSHQEIKDQVARGVATLNWRSPPLESQLADHTLWLEIKKLFGHNNEVVAMSISDCGQWIASTSKARYSQPCHVFVWKVHSISEVQLVSRLDGHESTAVCLIFSPCSRYLASGGKDRSICIHAQASASEGFINAICVKNAHKRIIWDCSWTSDSRRLVTVSRDGCCKVWALSTDLSTGLPLNLDNVYTFSPLQGEAITAVDVLSSFVTVTQRSWLMAIGGERGEMQIWALDQVSSDVSCVLTVPVQSRHGRSVRRIRWAPSSIPADAGERSHRQQLLWASCGEDNTVRVHRVTL